MKAIVIVILLTLVGCASKPSTPETYDTRASDYRRDIMLECGEAATAISDGDAVLADKLYGMCVFDQNLTI